MGGEIGDPSVALDVEEVFGGVAEHEVVEILVVPFLRTDDIAEVFLGE